MTALYLSPSRRQQLRAGGKTFTEDEALFQNRYRAHQEERRVADDRRS